MKNTMIAGVLGLSAVMVPFASTADEAPQAPVQVEQPDSFRVEDSSDVTHGKPVHFIYGSGVNSFTLQSVVESVEEAGCPVTTKQLSDTDRIIVKVGGKTIGSQDVVFAGMFALENCK